MIKLFIYVVLSVFYTCNAIAQKSENLALQSLEFLNQKFHWNLYKENKPILILVNDNAYVCMKYIHKTDVENINSLSLQYILTSVDSVKYEFMIKSPLKKYDGTYEYKGTFEVIENEQDFMFMNLRYVKVND